MRKFFLAAAVMSGLLIAISGANAYPFTKTSKVKIVTPIALTTVSDLSFGIIQVPTVSRTVIVSTAGVASGTATRLGGTISAGSYTVTGGGDTIKINISAGAAHSTGVTIASFNARYNGTAFALNSTILVDPTSTGKPLLIGATLTVTPAASTGNNTADYNITVLYQ